MKEVCKIVKPFQSSLIFLLSWFVKIFFFTYMYVIDVTT